MPDNDTLPDNDEIDAIVAGFTARGLQPGCPEGPPIAVEPVIVAGYEPIKHDSLEHISPAQWLDLQALGFKPGTANPIVWMLGRLKHQGEALSYIRSIAPCIYRGALADIATLADEAIVMTLADRKP